MTKLEELIEKLCPDGVEYKEIGSIAVLGAGGDVPKARFSAEKTVEFNIPIYSNGIEEKAIYGYTDIPKVDEPSITISARGTIGWCALRKEPFYPIVRLIYVTPNNEILIDFLKYVIDTIKFKVPKTGIPQLTIPMVSKYKIPVPPLEVQREIVRILDNFTFLTTELAAELAARQKQYEYYRDLLFLSLKAEYRFIPEFAKTYIGLVTTMTQHYVKEGVKLLFNSSVKENHFDFPKMVYLDNEFAEKNSSRMHKLGDIITVHTGDVGTSAIIDETLEGSLGFATIVTRIYNQEDVLPKYVSYYLSSNENKNNIYKLIKGDRNNLNLKDFNKLRVPIPSLEQQQRIVDILDRFDALCNDISSGLPAEIEMRQKQYEYYRDKLLTFKELKKEA